MYVGCQSLPDDTILDFYSIQVMQGNLSSCEAFAAFQFQVHRTNTIKLSI